MATLKISLAAEGREDETVWKQGHAPELGVRSTRLSSLHWQYWAVFVDDAVMCLRCIVVVVMAGCAPGSFGAVSRELAIVPRPAIVQGRDGGQSGSAWGHSVFTFGDTVLDKNDADGSNWHHNSYSVTDDVAAADGLGAFDERLDSMGLPRYFVAPTEDERAFNTAHQGSPCAQAPCGARWAAWPGAPLWDAPRNRALVFYGLIYAEPGAYNFHGVGQSVAVWDDFSADPHRPVLRPDGEHPTLLFEADEPSWGSGALIDGGMLYAFACDGDAFGPACRLARVDPADVLDRSAWRYWDGESWSPTLSGHTLFDGAPTVTVGHNAHLDKYIAIYCQPLSNHVVIRTADALTGPWSGARSLFDAAGTDSAYDANWHREYDDGASLFVTWSRTNHQGWFGSELALEQVTLPARAE